MMAEIIPVSAGNRAGDRLVRLLLLGLSVLVFYAACCQTLFLDREPAFDEIGLFNAVYTSLTSGHMTYPAHGDFSGMVVHPPTYYWLVAQLMKIGARAMTAATIVPLVVLAIDIALILTAPFSPALAASLLGGLFVGGVMFVAPVVLRPDWALALSWFGGIVALEAGRRAGWDPLRLALGGALVTLASALHYPGVTSAAAGAVYALYAIAACGPKRAWRPLAAMAIGSTAVALPFFVYFVIPQYYSILRFTSQVQGEGGANAAIALHRQAYQLMAAYFLPIGSWDAPTRMLTSIPIRAGVPAVLIAVPLLLAMPESRMMAVPAAIHPVFILFGSRGEGKLFQGYYTSEFILLGVAACLLIGTMTVLLVGRRNRGVGSVIAIAVVLTGTGISVNATGTSRSPFQGKWSATPWHADMEIARAAGRDMLGHTARVAGFAVTWFISGAHRMYFTDQTMLDLPELTSDEAMAILANFDAVAVQHHRTWLSYNRERINLTSLYAAGRLSLRGAYFGYSRGWDEAGLSYLLFAASRPVSLRAAAFDGSVLWRYIEDVRGNLVFASAVCPADEFNRTTLRVDQFITTWLPGPTNLDPSAALAAHEPRKLIRTFIADTSDFEHRIRPVMAGRCTFREAVRVRAERMDPSAALAALARSDSPINFMSSPEPRQDLPVVPLRIDWDHLSQPASSHALPMLVSTPAQPWAYGAVIPWHPVGTAGELAWLRVRVRVSHGDVAIGVLNSRKSDFQWRVQQPALPDVTTIYLPVLRRDDAGPIVIETGPNPISGRVTIESADVVLQPNGTYR
jgi:hypothetical protein